MNAGTIEELNAIVIMANRVAREAADLAPIIKELQAASLRATGHCRGPERCRHSDLSRP